MSVKTIGKISEFNRKVQFEWQIHVFLSYKEENSKFFSPEFPVLDSTWQIEIWPCFLSNEDSYSGTYVSLYLSKVKSKFPKTAQVVFAIKSSNNTLLNQKEKTCTFSDQGLGWPQYIERSTLHYNAGTYVPLGILTVVCSVIIQSNQQNFIGRPDKLVEDLKVMFDRKKDSDVILQINDDTISAHKSILSARSPVFAAMFENEMVEKQTGIVHITDCDLENFNAFLLYIYTGEVEFTKCDAFLLYKIADKYGVPELMIICVDFMIRSLCVENMCEVYIFGNQINENKLLHYAQRFFNQNFSEIVYSEPWKLLLKEDYNLANDLLKGIAPKVTIKDD